MAVAKKKNSAVIEIEQQQKVEDAINEWKKSRPDLLERKNKKAKQEGTYIRFPGELRVSLQLLAAKKHMGYQTYLKSILADHVEEAIKEGEIDPGLIAKAMAG